MKKWLALALKFSISVLLIWLLLEKAQIGFSDVKNRILEVSLAMAAFSFGLMVVQVGIGGLRWKVVLDAVGAKLGLLRATLIFYISIFFNQALPSSVGGDAVRMYKGYRAGISLAHAVNSVLLERAATVVALVLVVGATQPFFLPRVGEEAGKWVLPVVVLALLASIAGIAILVSLDRLPARFDRFRVVRGLRAMAVDARRVFFRPWPLARVTFWAVIGHVNLTFAVYLLARGLALQITWLDCLTLVPPVILATTLPISIAGWGVREGAMVYAFALIGVAEGDAIALSVLAGLVGLAVALPGGLMWVFGADRRGAWAELSAAQRLDSMENDSPSDQGSVGPDVKRS